MLILCTIILIRRTYRIFQKNMALVLHVTNNTTKNDKIPTTFSGWNFFVFETR